MKYGYDMSRAGYEYAIEVLDIVPPLSSGQAYEAKVTQLTRRQSSGQPESFNSDTLFDLRWGHTKEEAIQKLEADVRAWIDKRTT
jgi:hypothetical protein